MSALDELASKWQQCWQGRSIATQSIAPQISDVFQLLVTAYTQPDRYYHNLTHIDRVLKTISQFSNSDLVKDSHPIQEPLVVSLAAWFHDFVYDPQCSDNEVQSAKAARELLMGMGLSLDTLDRIQQLILATQGHRIDPDDADLCIFLDADLAIFGANSVEYQAYSQAIRREYSWVADAAYRVGRTQVLESFLQRDRLYCTDLLFDELESIARLNIKQEIASHCD